ncbi:SGNH/GDSL hydrolase family protein [Actinokineospora iranica]|uniref:GDSL-like Lipase/Acylhydrolase family protein n=1 Tax=Actinokineospora iranica TaxID=1271860 RepID=A0A1G6W4G0_9PSEU|nr:SGNH/GDSL hydrolase family protein [Actinokineospora iranica]SDD60810.1 GDSL-like Lipase/Acylhydrolase family protein [Actinokineospora iranica]
MRAAAMMSSLLVFLTAATPATAITPSVRFHHYVALGDSYASGPGIPDQGNEPAGCGRASRNYPGQLANWLRVPDFRDVTCGGATTAHMTAPQRVPGGENPPQFDALRQETDLVTITIGGNDVGFSQIMDACGRAGAADPTGSPCRAHFTASGSDVLAQRVEATGKRVRAVLAGVKERSPNAVVLVVGYLRILPPETGCWPQVPFAAGDNAYFDRVQESLNRTLAEVARSAGARFVTPYTYSLDRDSCQPPERRWVEPLRPAAPAQAVHPNENGMKIVAGLAWLTLRFARTP